VRNLNESSEFLMLARQNRQAATFLSLKADRDKLLSAAKQCEQLAEQAKSRDSKSQDS
jgi:hypothetical protein